MTTSPAAPPPGPIRVGGYTLLQRLGEGGMGVVHLARRDADGHRVALKVLRPHIVGDEEARARLAREVTSLARVHSPRVAEVIDADPWGEVPFVVTRYVPGPSLHEHVAAEGPVEDADLDWFALCLAEALAAVHDAGVLHRDVKPTNVLMEGRSPVLIDFGLARVADDPRLTHTGWLLGTPGYLAPEILYGDDATAASDVHSWAATVAFAGLGRPPFGRGPSMAVMDRVRRGEHDLSGLPSPMREAVRDALHPDPAARPTLPQLTGWLREQAGAPAPPVALSPTAVPPTALRPTRTRREPLDDSPTVHTGSDDPDDWVAAPTAVPATRLLPAAQAPGAAAGARRPDAWSDPWPDGWAEGDGGEVESWAGEPPVAARPRPPLAQRLRAAVLLGGLGAVAGAGLAAYPWPTLAVLTVLVWLLRAVSLSGSARSARREVRGRRWYDAPLAVVGAPWHLLAALPGSVLLLLWAWGIGLAGALLAYAFAPGAPVVLGAAGVAGAVGLWLGPGGSRLRGPVRGVVRPLSVGVVAWLLAVAVVLAATLVLAASAATRGVDWAPAQGDPVSGLDGVLGDLVGRSGAGLADRIAR